MHDVIGISMHPDYIVMSKDVNLNLIETVNSLKHDLHPNLTEGLENFS